MINFKKSTGKVGKLKRDLRINLDTIINKNLEIDDTDLDGEKVMMNLERGEYFMMNEVGSRIWEIISKPINVKNIIETSLSIFLIILHNEWPSSLGIITSKITKSYSPDLNFSYPSTPSFAVSTI